ncbi:DUF4892 domain-containing protein [Rhodanobacter aciditrophus]|uniref:DUF4892 domain-containing protein n=1 Tax=Rhodanobacter aciditrophus TaxID=1623218 RepID=A0ABW4B383_9GAMM
MSRLFRSALAPLFIIPTLSYAAVTEVPVFRGAQIIKSEPVESSSIEVPLAKIYRSGRGWEPESVERIDGQSFQTLYKIGRNVPLNEVVDFYDEALASIEGNTVLFQCESRNCGSSNAWANNFFNEYLLYGADQNQSLKVLKDAQNHYWVLYINRRGAGDVMVRLDEVVPKGSDAVGANILAQLNVADVPRIRSFLREQSDLSNIVAFVTSDNRDGNPIITGDKSIEMLKDGLNPDERRLLRFINLANMGNPAYGVNRVIFVSIK